MATRFGSAVQRGYWFGLLIAGVTDFLVALIISWAFGNEGGKLLFVALMIVGAVYAFQLTYGLISAIRYAAIFFLFEKNTRISAIVDQMVVAQMPEPKDFYGDPTEYLMSVVHSKDASNDAKLFAGATIGGLEALRSTSRGLLSMTAHMALEAAIQRYSKRFDLVG